MAMALVAAAGVPASARSGFKPPPIRHVFTIVLENKNFDASFGADSEAPYLANRLPKKGQLLTQYYGTGHFSLGNYITMISGQAENLMTQLDCQSFYEMVPGTIGPDGQALGAGCVFPSAVKNITDQFRGKALRWRSYNQDMGKDPSREARRCGAPALGAQDPTQHATPKDQYAARHNPFVYFHSILDRKTLCRNHVVSLDKLKSDLKRVRTTRHYTFITPDLCADGHDETCADPNQKGGYPGINEFLRKWVPKITRSKAYRNNGLLMITFDESESGAESCCFTPTGPNAAQQGLSGPGGGRTGAVLLSPWIKPGTTNDTPYNHYSLLRSVEDIFKLRHLGYAARPEVSSFGRDVFRKHRVRR
ncbi:alkaline phosphatase family protein [soil metagenome]